MPITFRDRRVGQSKMSRRIIVEALLVVVPLRFDELRDRLRGRGPVVSRGAPAGWAVAATPPTRGVRVVLDARPLQAPDRAPARGGLSRGAAPRLRRRSRSLANRSRSSFGPTCPIPTTRFERLDVVGRRLLPPDADPGRGRMTVDPFLLRGASLGVAWRADRAAQPVPSTT